ncbi:MAG: hypothetical protein WAU68_17310 [Vitreimonas sp.]
MRHGHGREGVVQLGTFESGGGSQVREAMMSRPTQYQTGAFFGILASALILVLTAMALVSTEGRPHHRYAQEQISEATPAGFHFDQNRTASASR